jgi:hypothetical protein
MTTATKTPVTTTWNVQQIQESAVEHMSRNMMATFQVIEKLGPEAKQQWHQALTQMKVEHLKKQGAKTPFEVVKAIAEFEVNVLGSKISVWGDDKQASMEYEKCACWEAMQKACPMDAKKEEEMGKCWAESLNQEAKLLGFSKAEVKFEGKPVVTFIK